ncbi:hypothetical protein [Nitrosomonas ureae]|uniref:hypothetical protein n=1 Tax=Nitrosomonas ureae TaxID=44577 RepID=UPI00072071F8|nr:hypothetical protein [Nitrosomonas ureae]ALQ52063.1 hypothetical protein ATY38_13070 [Nitrosomonas ureae]ALQ52078.1 hypothetical protein ATY38_13145 [Nitrosomonas ureae]
MKLKHVSKNMRQLYKELIGIRDTAQRSRIEGSTPQVSFTKKHELQIQSIERMEKYLSPSKIRE